MKLGRAASKSGTAGHAGPQRLRHLRQELAHRGRVPAAGSHAGIRNAGGLGSASSAGKSDAYSASGQGVGVSSQELLNALLGSAKPVSGSWGSGTLVTTSLVSMLITGGEVYIGAVQPSVLYAAVGHTAS